MRQSKHILHAYKVNTHLTHTQMATLDFLNFEPAADAAASHTHNLNQHDLSIFGPPEPCEEPVSTDGSISSDHWSRYEKQPDVFASDAALDAWEFDKHGTRKSIHILLINLHTVLWSNSDWVRIGINDVADERAIKKQHRKVLLVVHPDKLQDPGPDKLRVALRLFTVINDAFKRTKHTPLHPNPLNLEYTSRPFNYETDWCEGMHM